MRLWKVASGKAVGEPLRGPKDLPVLPVRDVAFAPDGDRIASAGEDKAVWLWNVGERERQPVGDPWEGHEAAVNSVSFSSDGRRVVSGSDDRNLRVWDADTGKGIGDPLIGHWEQVVDAVFAGNGDRLRVLSASRDGIIRTWPVPLHGYAALCDKLTQNPSRDQWLALAKMPQGVEYEGLCPDLLPQ
ncbi:MAG: hypothetical protein ABWX68_03995 [Arthrobacter sp.]|uniref:WD40 repeat domain-containing protein n=1 Tax=Arthrobacter sp. TaxID=1667 RepID=UPI003499681C